MRRTALRQALEKVPAFARPLARLEQVVTPAEAAVTLLAAAERIDGLSGRSVLDLGCGTGRLAIGAALLGARPVRGLDVDPSAVTIAEQAAREARVSVAFRVGDAGTATGSEEIVVMNPPFGAQRRHADRPFWERAMRIARRSVYAFALSESRTFIAGRAVESGVAILEVGPVPWALPRTFPHHARRSVPLDVDLWALRTGPER